MASAQSTTLGSIVTAAIKATAITMTGNLALGGNNATGIGTPSGATLQVDNLEPNDSNAVCVQTGGTLGTCSDLPSATGDCNCT